MFLCEWNKDERYYLLGCKTWMILRGREVSGYADVAMTLSWWVYLTYYSVLIIFISDHLNGQDLLHVNVFSYYVCGYMYMY